MSDSAALAIGTRFVERFEIASVLAMGRRGTTYAAHDVRGGGTVALLHVLTMMTERQRRGFDELAPRLASLQHPGLVPLVASGVVEHRPWFASRLVAGISVEEALRTHGTFPMRRAAELICQAARALAVAHAAGILHRSLKPSNLLLVDGAASEVVVVLDLGIGAILCSDGRSVATPQFCAPEESSGLGVDARTDVYALGAILFQMLTGRAPFDAPTAAALVEAHRTQAPPRLRALKASAEPLEAIVNRALAKRPADRFATMQDFAAAIEEVLAAPAVPLAVDSSDPAPEVAPTASRSPSTWHVVDAKEARTLATTNLARPTPLETVALSSAAPAASRVAPVDSAPPAKGRRARRGRELWFVVGLTLLATAFGVGLGMWWASQ